MDDTSSHRPLGAQIGKLSCGTQRWMSTPSSASASWASASSAATSAGADAWKQASSFFVRKSDERLPLLADLEAGSLGSVAMRVMGRGGTGPPASRLQYWCRCWCLPALSYRQRIVGAAFCFVSGLLLLGSSLLSLTSLLLGSPGPFAVKYTLGNLLSICAIGFLVGWSNMCRLMCSRERRVASLIYLLSLCGTLLAVLRLQSQLLVTFAVLVQFAELRCYGLRCVLVAWGPPHSRLRTPYSGNTRLPPSPPRPGFLNAHRLGALAWSGASYLPFGQRTLRLCFKSVRAGPSPPPSAPLPAPRPPHPSLLLRPSRPLSTPPALPPLPPLCSQGFRLLPF